MGKFASSAKISSSTPASGKALIRWVCTLEGGGQTRAWRGLDVLHFDGRLVREKHTYAKAAVPLLGEVPSELSGS
jgi:hypothetical protein